MLIQIYVAMLPYDVIIHNESIHYARGKMAAILQKTHSTSFFARKLLYFDQISLISPQGPSLQSANIGSDNVCPKNMIKSQMIVAYFTEEVNPSLDKLPLNSNGSLARIRLTCFVK